MYKHFPKTRFGTATIWLIASVVFTSGCEKTESVAKYSVPRHDSLQSTEFLASYEKSHPKPQRMIGIVIPKGSLLWFFKLQGAVDQVGSREGDLRNFLKTVTFSEDDKVKWTLPAAWQQLPGSEMRHATLMLDGTPELELTVTKFPARPDLSITEQVLMNINRWRGQLQLPPIDETDLDSHAEKIQIGDVTGYLTNVIGRPQAKPASMTPPVRTEKKIEEKRETEGNAPAPLVYDKPESWVEGPPTQFAALSLRISEGEQKAVVTVTAAGGDKLLNVNRWRGQVGLGPLAAEELAATAKKVDVGSRSGDLYEIVAEDRAIFGVIVDDQGQMWFIKMMGDASLVERERDRFEGFLKSLQLTK